MDVEEAQAATTGRLELQEPTTPRRPMPGVRHGRLARERRDGPAGLLEHMPEPGVTGEPLHGHRVRRLLEEDEIGLERGDGRGQQRDAATTAEPDVVADDAQHSYASSVTYGVPWSELRRSRNQSAIACSDTGRPASSWASPRGRSSLGATQRASSHSGIVFTPGR